MPLASPRLSAGFPVRPESVQSGHFWKSSGLRLLIAGCILGLMLQDALQGATSRGPLMPRSAGLDAIADSIRSTRSGAYTAEQADRGKALYAMNCISCHTAVSHTGPAFVGKWESRLLWELYQYISEAMPKSEPGSLSRGEYTRVLAYLLQMNGAPAGPDELTPDSTALKQIRIELKPR